MRIMKITTKNADHIESHLNDGEEKDLVSLLLHNDGEDSTTELMLDVDEVKEIIDMLNEQLFILHKRDQSDMTALLGHRFIQAGKP